MSLHSIWGVLHAHAHHGKREVALAGDASWTLRGQDGVALGQLCATLADRDTGQVSRCPDSASTGWQLPAATVRWHPATARLELQRGACGGTALFYAQQGDALYFASQLQQLLALLPGHQPQVEPIALLDILAWGRILPPYTLYRDLHCVAPGHTVTGHAGPQLVHCEQRQDWNWVQEIARQLNAPPQQQQQQQPVRDDGPARDTQRVALALDCDLHGHQTGAHAGAQQRQISADDTCNAIPLSVGDGWMPLGDIAEAAFTVALATQKERPALSCDLSADLLRILAKPLPGQDSQPDLDHVPLSFMSKRRLRARLNAWKTQRAAPLLQTLQAIQQLAPRHRLHRDALFRLLYVLPDRRQRLHAAAARQRQSLRFDCAAPAALAAQIATSLRGQAPPPDERAVHLVIGSEALSLAGTGSNPYDRANALYLDPERAGIDHMPRYFRLSQWSIRNYWQQRSSTLGSAIEQRLCAILSAQYLLHFT